ncbi:MAG: hypothetical protein JO270_08790 [Acidobacteriaceae bacterium]|nr:hypothetical protein [Acidobacteriaceae bacterium]
MVPLEVTDHDPANNIEPNQSCSVVIEAQSTRITITGPIDVILVRTVLECLAR